MWGHSDAVTTMLPFAHDAFVSCAADGLVVLWKDGRSQSELRNRFATASLLHHHLSLSREPSLVEEDEPEWADESTLPSTTDKQEEAREVLPPWSAAHDALGLEITASGDTQALEMNSQSLRFIPQDLAH